MENYTPITIQVATFNGNPVTYLITEEEQKEFIEGGYGTLDDLISFIKQTYNLPYGG